ILAVAVDADVPDPTPEDLAANNPSAKVIDKAKASQKRKASTSGAALGHVAKLTRSAVAQSSGSTTRPNLFADDSGAESDDDDACYEILIVTPIRSAAVIPLSRNQSGGYAALAAEGLNTQGFRGKGIMTDVDAAVAPSVGASHPRVSSGPAPSFKELYGDAIHKDLFPFSLGPYYATYPEGGIAGNCEFTREEWDAPHQPTLKVLTKEVFKDPSVCKTVVDQFPTPREMIRIEALSSDQLTAKMSVLHCLMMSHGGKLLSWYHGLLQSHHKYVQSTDSRLKGYQEKFASLTGLESQALVRKFLASDEFSRVQAELLSLAASAGFERGLSMHRTKEEFAAVLKKISQFISEHAAEPLSIILQLEPEKLARPTNVPASRDAYVSPSIANESTVTLASTSLELLSNTVPTSSAITLELNGVSHVVDDVTELTVTGSKHASFGPGDVVVPLSAGEKGDGSVPSSTIEEVVAPPSVA
ncbi:hypothetical protein Tco_1431513, partial [Tanacetum coccineum]